MRLLLLATIALSGLLLTPVVLPAAAQGCGIPPIPPLPPIGCRTMHPECICDGAGNCHWEFECVR